MITVEIKSITVNMNIHIFDRVKFLRTHEYIILYATVYFLFEPTEFTTNVVPICTYLHISILSTI